MVSPVSHAAPSYGKPRMSRTPQDLVLCDCGALDGDAGKALHFGPRVIIDAETGEQRHAAVPYRHEPIGTMSEQTVLCHALILATPFHQIYIWRTESV